MHACISQDKSVRLSVRLSVCLSKCIICDKKKESFTHNFLPCERTLILVFQHTEWLVADERLYMKCQSDPIHARMLSFNRYFLVAPHL